MQNLLYLKIVIELHLLGKKKQCSQFTSFKKVPSNVPIELDGVHIPEREPRRRNLSLKICYRSFLLSYIKLSTFPLLV